MAPENNKTLSEKEIVEFVSQEGCFDLQFRRDVKHKRTQKPIYYYWKAQFVLTGSYEEETFLRAVQTILDCGRLHFTKKNTIRYSVQDIDSLHNKVIVFFDRHSLQGKKKHDFQLWQQAIQIMFSHKGKPFKNWSKQDFQSLIDIQKSMQPFKTKKPSAKWLNKAEEYALQLK